MFIYPFISLWITSSDSSCFIHLQYHKPIYIFIKAQIYLSIHHIYYIYLSPHKLLQFRTLRSDCTQRPHQRLAAGVLKRGWRRARGLCWAAEARWRGRAGGARRVETAPPPPAHSAARASLFFITRRARVSACLPSRSLSFALPQRLCLSARLCFCFRCLCVCFRCLCVCLFVCMTVNVCLSVYLSLTLFSLILFLFTPSLLLARVFWLRSPSARVYFAQLYPVGRGPKGHASRMYPSRSYVRCRMQPLPFFSDVRTS